MRSARIQFTDVVLLLTAAPIWVSLVLMLVGNPKFQHETYRAPLHAFVLIAATYGMHRLLRGFRHGLAISILLAGIIPGVVLFVAVALSR